MNQAQRIWITGANGYIGSRLAAHLSSLPADLGLIGRKGIYDACYTGCVNVIGNLNKTNLAELTKNTGLPDVVIHLAGTSTVQKTQKIEDEARRDTVDSTRSLVEYLTSCENRTKIIALSSAAVYGQQLEGCLSTESPQSPVSLYGIHKLKMEESIISYCESTENPYVILRAFSVYGPGMRKQLLWDICEKARRNGRVELYGNGSEARDWIYIDDLVKIMCKTMAKDYNNEIFNVGTGIATSVRDIASMVIAEINKTARTSIEGPLFANVKRSGDPDVLVSCPVRDGLYESSRLKKPVDGVREYVRWYCDNFMVGE